MPRLLRIVNLARWMKLDPDWLPDDDFPADPVCDLRTKDNVLSTWVLSEDDGNLERLVAGLAVAREKLTKFDWAIFDTDLLDELGIEERQTQGQGCPDIELCRDFHYHLTNISANRLVRLAKAISAQRELKRLNPQDVAICIARALHNGWLTHADINPKIAKRLERIRKVRDLFPDLEWTTQ